MMERKNHPVEIEDIQVGWLEIRIGRLRLSLAALIFVTFILLLVYFIRR
jgi:hypothetical protein